MCRSDNLHIFFVILQSENQWSFREFSDTSLLKETNAGLWIIMFDKEINISIQK